MISRLSPLVLIGCVPVVVGHQYPALVGELPDGSKDYCSYSFIDDRTIATATHCVIGSEKIYSLDVPGLGWFSVPFTLQLSDGDYSELYLEDDAEQWLDLIPSYLEHGEPSSFGIACYISFRGKANCGHILWWTDKHIEVITETREAVGGDSGSGVYDRDHRFLGVVSDGFGPFMGVAR